MRNYEVNILPINIISQYVDISFSIEQFKDSFLVKKGNLPENIPVDFFSKVERYAWYSWKNNLGEAPVKIDLQKNRRFAKAYFNKLVYDYFSHLGVVINSDFINETEVWIKATDVVQNDVQQYSKFTLRIDNNSLIEGTSLLLSYRGESFVFKSPLSELNIDKSLVNLVIYENQLKKYRDFSAINLEMESKLFVVKNYDIRKSNNDFLSTNPSENKYKKYYEKISMFYNEYLKGKNIDDGIRVYESGFYKPYSEKIYQTSDKSNLLLFGNNQKNYVPYIGLKENGPLSGPKSNKPIKFFFIFHEEDRELANKIYSYLKKGYKSFPGLESFVNIKFEIDSEKTIRYKERNPLSEITQQIDQKEFDQSITYVALYISRINKDSFNADEDEVYYKLKEKLLGIGITSQVLSRDKILNPSYNFFLPNISIALLAKLGGIPWRLFSPIKNDLIIGVGADRSKVSKGKYIGNAFCFSNDGNFHSFNAYEKEDSKNLADSIREAIHDYLERNHSCDRLVVHYYKCLNKEEEKPINDLLQNLSMSLPYIVVTINSRNSEDYVIFDSSFGGMMPISGTYLMTKKNEYILCNNTRYSTNSGIRIDGFPLPIKMRFYSPNYERINDPAVVRELIDQVYQFSRMYWKSVRQRSLPVTIEYPELVAKMYSHFNDKELPPFARETLWFL